MGSSHPVDRPPWHRSPYDGQLHMFGKVAGTVAEALCEHSVPVDQLEPPNDDDRRCVACIMMFGLQVSNRIGDPGNYVM